MLNKSLLATATVVLGAALATAGWTPAEGARADSALSVQPSSSASASLRLVVTPTGNEARYRIRERLVGMDLPYDAIGRTREISGAVELDEDGRVAPSRSRIVVDLTHLMSDKERRDGYVQRRLLETERYPTAELVPTELRGLPSPLPASGSHSFEMLGNLTVRGVSRPTTWTVTARFQEGKVTGSASTAFTFEDFELTRPRVPVILSLADTIQLEYDFDLARAEPATR